MSKKQHPAIRKIWRLRNQYARDWSGFESFLEEIHSAKRRLVELAEEYEREENSTTQDDSDGFGEELSRIKQEDTREKLIIALVLNHGAEIHRVADALEIRREHVEIIIREFCESNYIEAYWDLGDHWDRIEGNIIKRMYSPPSIRAIIAQRAQFQFPPQSRKQ